jgi:hypothetical protein
MDAKPPSRAVGLLAGYADWTGEITVEAGKPATVVGELQQH